MLRITFLGTAGSLPTVNRNPSAIMVNRDGEMLLFDCGEGTQQQMMKARTGMKGLSSIFISHFHADHVLGIPGLTQTMSFQGRTDPLYIYGPRGVEDFISCLVSIGYDRLNFEIRPVRMEPGDVVDKDGYSIKAIRTEHSVPSLGYALVEDQRPGRFDRQKAISLGIPVGPLFSRLQKGESVEVDGKRILPDDVIGPSRSGRTLVYTGDTRPCSSILDASKGADLLIHDATLADEMQEWARESMHSTSSEAARLARDANVGKLVLTHISSRYSDDASLLLKEARGIFENVVVAEDLMVIEVPYD